MILVACLWLIACGTSTQFDTAIQAQTATVEIVISPIPILPTNTVEPTPIPASPTPELTVIWQDTFDNVTSGWEPRYEVDTIAKSTGNERLLAWNGYENSGYQFILPVMASEYDRVAPFLWDFNTVATLPSYPYQVDVDVQTGDAGNPMMIFDFQGDINKVSSGQGIAITWGMRDPSGYKNVSNWPVYIAEFSGGRTWKLACTNNDIPTFIRTTLHARLQLTATTLHITLDDTQIECARTITPIETAPRIMAIGAALAQSMVPVVSQNRVTYDNLRISSPKEIAPVSITGPATEVFDADLYCQIDGLGDDGTKRPINIVDIYTQFVKCNNQYFAFSFDFPGYGPVRLPTPNTPDLYGNWSCGNGEYAQFSLTPEKDYLIMRSTGTSIVVFYAKTVAQPYEEQATTPDGYMVTFNGTFGGQGVDSHDFAQIGDGIGSAIGYRYFFTYKDNQIITNWTAQPCKKTS